MEGLKVGAPVMTAFAALNAALPQPSVYVRTRISSGHMGEETDPRVQIIFSNNGSGVMYPESIEWVANGKPFHNICHAVKDSLSNIDCGETRTIYFNKPFESHAKLHLWTFRPQDPTDTDFYERVVNELNKKNIHARISFRYFHMTYGWSSTRDLLLINKTSQPKNDTTYAEEEPIHVIH